MRRSGVRSVLALLAACALAGCVRVGQGATADANGGTCYGVCDHYLGCKGDERQASRDTCLAECREIFVQDGEADRESLREFEELECEAAVAFVDGEPPAKRSAIAGSVDGHDAAASP